MNDRDRQQEARLRAQARARPLNATRDSRRAAMRVLADFYEQRGQLSRAEMWRDDEPGANPRDDLVPNPKWRRKVMMWLLGNSLSSPQVATLFRSSPSWTRTLIREVENKICEAANEERHNPTLAATLRLQAAGALPKRFDRGAFWLGDEPPESWPRQRRRGSTRKPHSCPSCDYVHDEWSSRCERCHSLDGLVPTLKEHADA